MIDFLVPFHLLQLVNFLPFDIFELKKVPFRVKPPRVGYYRKHPLLPA